MSSNLVKSKVHFNFNGTQVHKKKTRIKFLVSFLFYLKSKMQNLNVKSKFLKKLTTLVFAYASAPFIYPNICGIKLSQLIA